MATTAPLLRYIRRWQTTLAARVELAAARRRPPATKAVLDRLAPFEAEIRETLRVWNAAEEARTLSWLRTQGALPPLDMAHVRQLERLLDQTLVEVLTQEYGQYTGGMPNDRVGLEAIHQIRHSVETYANTTQRWLQERVGPLLTEATPMAERLRAVEQVYAQTQSQRAQYVASTETHRMAQAARVAAARAEGETVLTWKTADDNRVCAACADLEGELVTLGAPLYTVGQTITTSQGSTLDITYSDVAYPPLHVQCRCVLV